LQYYLERNLEARERELAREEELEEKAPKVKAKSKMSKVHCNQAFIMPFPYIWFSLVYFNNPFFWNSNAGRESCQKEAEGSGLPTKQAKIEVA